MKFISTISIVLAIAMAIAFVVHAVRCSRMSAERLMLGGIVSMVSCAVIAGSFVYSYAAPEFLGFAPGTQLPLFPFLPAIIAGGLGFAFSFVQVVVVILRVLRTRRRAG